ncbi:hypothetical protein SAMN06295905_0514 [Devosia lucknowensis]|uniref:DUF2059 domain-containing protein n=1 Tax=Devosia lucknowensis TaxID=1096929 RepID=A0A1Y6EFM7_9HYPH|nr:DUF2059 domain-containing protein [Devosia lucknowensis]SMQ61385.1 hypothetical protein SAMN06295905_0514 [Devosia lucknowensis]
MAFWNIRNWAQGVRIMAVLAVVAGAVAPAVQAQEVAPEQLALARKYIDLTDRGAVFETTVVEIGIDTMRQIVTQNPEIQEQTDEVIGDVIKDYNGRKGELLDQFARVYAIYFTLEELTAIVAFYESPTGQKLAQANAELNTDIRRVLQVYTNNLRTEFFAKVRAGLRDKGVEL